MKVLTDDYLLPQTCILALFCGLRKFRSGFGEFFYSITVGETIKSNKTSEGKEFLIHFTAVCVQATVTD